MTTRGLLACIATLISASCGNNAIPVGAVDLAGGNSPLTCMGPGNVACDPVIGCPDLIGCNWCSCNFYGMQRPGAVCHLTYCSAVDDAGMVIVNDAGMTVGNVPVSCRSSADCPHGHVCNYQPGCTGAPGMCIRATLCEMADGLSKPPQPGNYPVCDCNGNTVMAPIQCGVQQPYRSWGKCP